MATYIAMIVIQPQITKDSKMKLLTLLLGMIALGCNSSEAILKWQGKCFPHQFLSDASFITSNKGDTAFDKKLSNAPILFFPADYVVKHIKEFKPFDKNKYNHYLPVNFEPVREIQQETNDDIFKKFPDVNDLFTTKDREEFSFSLFTKVENKYIHWGNCVHSTVDSYDCFRTITFDHMNIRYGVHKDNISTYKKIDHFILEHLNKWQCD
jgi:hypothetical protein